VVLAICIFALPNIIGSIELDGYDPILLGIYLSTIPFFIAIYQSLKLLNYIDKNKVFSDLSIKALKTIRYCAITISALYIIGMPYIFKVADKDDAPGVVAIGLFFALVPIVIAVLTTILQNILQDVLKNYIKKI
ncbi:MAG: DUF2975 domain-containing protein, partial [Patescibacteria group bacterium]